MKKVAKYNLTKGVSSVLTFGTPIITLACTGDFFVHRSESAVSAAAMFVILIWLFFAKDKFLENFKLPGPFVLCAIAFGLVLIIENILFPIKAVCVSTMIATGVDEFTFKRMYKQIELTLPEIAETYKKFGFLFTTSKTLGGN